MTIDQDQPECSVGGCGNVLYDIDDYDEDLMMCSMHAYDMHTEYMISQYEADVLHAYDLADKHPRYHGFE